MEEIGKGGFGIVLKGKQKYIKEILAIKIIKLKDMSDKDFSDSFKEAKIMRKLKNKYVVKYENCWTDKHLGKKASKILKVEEEEIEEEEEEEEKEEDDDDDSNGKEEELNFGFSKTTIDKEKEKLKKK